ncbi:hypothetical protein CLAFUW4_01148 [Fulvia fulva]|uniref:Uncharacterized protein n=1 Tax=Passalora fulva TaxID=5499 RepID=A0A9Q8LA19_PASFU|nr:uncharacterized protein CLAFUR5_01153 [Fulvia fulva]KAK4635085.1 hypothetical protein CLAFUR4_01149 [Fulvia fulva]KAK4636408.1 hypothetical protein CLAFUR0_01150 [Fulvia fulva]UJO12938.1 hypothetical protein CLAFUR5_01153 [Fulvia fulva]WPV10097.1 hypothetical protein CLAFUW4_01148 [Fulvia fulva]WPV25294.1 hypothetical protein CLAFUW7_01153 [Fulvia fulva]
MAPSTVSDFTPVKVRGKRHCTPAEKWYTGKRRKPALQKRSHLSTATSSVPLSTEPRKRRRVEGEDDSPLEMLPAEVIHHIFEYSANVNLPLVSRHLAAKLSKSTHLELQLTETILSPVLRRLSNDDPGAAQLAAATRLLNSRFMTFNFFKSWLQVHNPAGHLHKPNIEHADTDWRAMWTALQPSSTLLPPRKLLSPPFTEAKSNFLSVLAQEWPVIATVDPVYGDFALQGLQCAVAECRRDVVAVMLRMGVPVSTELLRVAVIDGGCDSHVVLMLLERIPQAGASWRTHEEINLLDPSLWAWAEKACKDGNDKGRWLIDLLRARQQRKTAAEPSVEVLS